MKISKTLLFILSLFSLSPVFATSQADLETQRELYQQAKKALQSNQIAEFRTLKARLTNYPLQDYLQYLYLLNRLSQSSSAEIESFLTEQGDSFYTTRLRNAWLNQLAERQQWAKFIEHYQAPFSNDRQCYYGQALISTGDVEAAKKHFNDLWLVGQSQPKTCDDFFKVAEQRDWVTDELRWERMMLALRAQEFSLARFLARSVNASATANAWIDRWHGIHERPDHWLNKLPSHPLNDQVSLAHDLPMSREIIVHGMMRLARQDPDKAYPHWQRIKNVYDFSDEQRQAVQRQMGLWAALNRNDNALLYFADTRNEPWRVRAALWQQDWQAVQAAINSMDDTIRNQPRWQYWFARSLAETGQPDDAKAIWETLVHDRDYYAYLAADRLGVQYAMNHHPIAPTEAEIQAIKQLPSYQRLREFFALNEDLEMRREAFHLQQTLDSRQLQVLATETFKWNWPHQTIAFLGAARYWDAIDERFPVLYRDEMLAASKQQVVDAAWLLAIARQESAFNPNARSHAGAMGLMQVMPETGRSAANQMNKPLSSTQALYRPDRNIDIGSFYIRRMQNRLQGNPVLATAAYNAGPHRVERWLPETDLPADIWIENIPFNETRRYLRAVLSYAAIYDYQLGQPITPLADRMPTVRGK